MTRLFAGTPFDIPPECEDCGKVEAECLCTTEQKAAAEESRRRNAARKSPDQQTAKVGLENRKGGRQVTVVDGLTNVANDLPELLGKLQAACGTGGTVKAKEDRLELQGDQVQRIRETLAEIGFRIAK